MKTFASLCIALLIAGILLLPTCAPAQTWQPYGYYTQPSTYFTTVQPPINADGSSSWPAKQAGVVPVKFAVSVGLGDLTIISLTDADSAHAYGGVQFTVPAGVTLNNMGNLRVTGVYPFQGCGAGSPRFTLYFADGGLAHVYLGNSTGGDPNAGCGAYAGGNLMAADGVPRFELDNSGTYITLADAQNSNHGNSDITGGIFVVDNGTAQATLETAEIGTTTYTFPSAATPTCTLPSATIDIQQINGESAIEIPEDLYDMPADTGAYFRVDGCQYAYNVSTKHMTAGEYRVFANINGGGDVTTTPGEFSLK